MIALAITTFAPALVGAVQNYNIGFLLPYSLDDQPGVFTNSSTVKFNVIANDAAAEMAVNDFNAASTLPNNGQFNILRKNNWDPNFATNWQLVDSGGYSAIAATKMVQQNNSVAVFGDYLDTTTSFTAEVLSYFQVPFCGSTQIDPTLSDKSNYEYFMRMQNGYDAGSHILNLLAMWNVTKVSIIVGPDTYSSAYGDDISTTISGNKSITVLAKLMISPEMQVASDYSYPIGVLNTANSRYFIITADANLTADFYYAARDAQLTGSNFVWLGTNRPYVGDLSLQTTLYGANAINDLNGFFWLKDDLKPSNDPSVLAFNSRWLNNNAQNPTKYPVTETGGVPRYAARSYDCVKLLTIGIAQGLTANPTMNLQSLIANKYFRNLMFANTSYDGLLHNPITLGLNGDLQTPKLLISVNSTVMSASVDSITADYALGISTSSVVFSPTTSGSGSVSSSYQEFRPIVFAGGVTSPPNDGWIPIVATERVIGASSPTSTAIYICSIIGHIVAGVAILFYAYQKVTKSPGVMNLAYTVFLVLGSELVFISMFWWPGSETRASCIIHRYLIPIGYSLSYGSIFAKLFHLSRCLQNKFERARGVSDLSVLMTVSFLAIVNAIIAIIYQYAGNPTAVSVTISRYEYYYTCQTTDQTPGSSEGATGSTEGTLGNYLTYAFYVVGGLLSLACVFYSHKLKKEPNMKVLDILCKIAVLSGGTMIAIPFLSPQTMLPRILRAFVSWALSLGTIVVAFIPSISATFGGKQEGDGSDFDLASVIKSGINRDDWSVLESGPLEVLNMGQVHYQTRGILGWTEPKLADMIVHRRKSQITMTFSEVNSYVVNAFNVSNIISDDIFDVSRQSANGSHQATKDDTESNKKRKDHSSELDERIIVITTKSFSIKVIASSTGQAAEIRSHVFGVKDGEAPSTSVGGTGAGGVLSGVRKSTAI